MSQQDQVRRRTQPDGRKAIVNGSTDHEFNSNNTRGGQSEKTTKSSSATAVASIFSPVLITTLALIFGGCCSNVYTLESILKLSPATGTLITFLQFLLTSFFTVRTQITTQPTKKGEKSSLYPRLRKRIIPLSKWIIYTLFFLTVNVLNNAAFDYRISIPLHIILRSAGPVTSMMIGYVVGGRSYTPRQITAVVLLFAGVVLAALSDAQNKSHSSKSKVDEVLHNTSSSIKTSTTSKLSEQIPGFILLFSALLLSAIMGIYTDNLYTTYGRSTEVTNENLFYSHTLSLPFFALKSQSLQTQFNVLTTNLPSSSSTSGLPTSSSTTNLLPPILNPLFSNLPYIPFLTPYLLTLPKLFQSTNHYHLIPPILLLTANALTQIICIIGVNRLSTQTTSLTVSIILNIRKLVSLLLSIWLFGNRLPLGVVVGAAMVFAGGGLYGFKGGNKEKERGKVEGEGTESKEKGRKEL